MLNALREFFRRTAAGVPERHFDADDERLALAALLVHCTAIDGMVSETEKGTLRAILGRSFGLSGADLETLIADAVAAERDAVDLYGFTSILKRRLSQDERVRVVERLWEVAFADGRSHEFEENLVWRVAELLGVTRQDRIARKQAVAENRAPGEDAAQ